MGLFGVEGRGVDVRDHVKPISNAGFEYHLGAARSVPDAFRMLAEKEL